MPRIKGWEKAIELLNRMPAEARKKLLTLMHQKNPELTDALEKNLVQFEDLLKASPVMLMELYRSVRTHDLGMAMRLASPALRDHLLKNAPKLTRQELEDVLKGPMQLTSTLQQSLDVVMDVVRKKLVLKDDDPLV